MKRSNPTGLKAILRALRSRNYRLFFIGQAISLIGTWMQTVAASWLAYRLSNSAFILGIVGFVGDIPSFLFMSIAGVMADRWDKRKILLLTQSMAMLQAFILAALSLTGTIRIWHLISLNAFLGLINAFDMPTRQAFVVEMLENKNDLPNAIALNSSIFNSARMIGPSIAGILISTLGEGFCFLINGLSFGAVIAVLLAMKITTQSPKAKIMDTFQGLKQGFAYAFGFLPIRAMLLLVALVSLLGMSYAVLMPVLARDILHGGPNTLGFLMASSGSGALIAAIYLAARRSVLGLGRMIPLSLCMFSVSIICMALSRNLILSAMLMFIAGFGVMTQVASSNTLIQTIVEEDKRGRVMGIYTMCFRGIAPFGSLLAGTLASRLGAPNTLLLGGIVCLLGALWFFRTLPEIRKLIQPIYIKAGIIPEIAQGINPEPEVSIQRENLKK